MLYAPGASMYTQSGGMAWMTEGITMDSNMRGGSERVSAECSRGNQCLWQLIRRSARVQ